MTLKAFLLIFASVFMHAAWNFMSKKESPTAAFYMLAALAGTLFWLPWSFFSGIDLAALPGKFWAVFLISNFFEVLYFTALAHGYRHGDISLVYPLGRALPVLMIAGLTAAFHIGSTPSRIALAGMGIIFAGCVIMPLGSWREMRVRTYCTRVLFWVLMIAAGTTGYTIFDSMAMGALRNVPGRSELFKSLFYIFLVEAGVAVSMLPVLFRREARREMKKISVTWFPYAAGIFSASAYVLILLAMNEVSNVSYLQAFRQMSLPLGMLAGVFFLRESCSPPKVVGIVLLVAGLVMTCF